MSPSFPLLTAEFCQRLTLTLLHMLWIGTAVGLAILIADWLLQRSSARMRYSLNLLGLLAMLCCLPATYAVVSATSAGSSSPTASQVLPADSPLARTLRDADLTAIITADGTFTVASTGALSLSSIAPYATAGYLAVLVVMLSRLSIQCGGTSRLRRHVTPVTDSSLHEMLETMSRRLGLKRIPALAWSDRIGVPAVVGIVRPMIVLPLRLATGLGPDEMRAVLTHELAHIRRYDPLMHLFQSLAESLLFFHPFVWIISRRVSIERENCCDDAVLASGWEPVDYAQSLVRLAEACSAGSASELDNRLLALAATGDGSSAFSGRVRRLLGLPSVSRLRPFRSGSLAVAIVGVAAVVAAVLQPAQETLGEGASDKNELRLTFADDIKNEPGESIYNDKLRRYKFRLEESAYENMGLVDVEFVKVFLVNYYEDESHPPLLGALPDPLTNSLIVIGPPEADQAIRTTLAKWQVERTVEHNSIAPSQWLDVKKKYLEHERILLIEEIATIELAAVDQAAMVELEEKNSRETKKRREQVEILEKRIASLNWQVEVLERKLKVIDASLKRRGGVNAGVSR